MKATRPRRATGAVTIEAQGARAKATIATTQPNATPAQPALYDQLRATGTTASLTAHNRSNPGHGPWVGRCEPSVLGIVCARGAVRGSADGVPMVHRRYGPAVAWRLRTRAPKRPAKASTAPSCGLACAARRSRCSTSKRCVYPKRTMASRSNAQRQASMTFTDTPAAAASHALP